MTGSARLLLGVAAGVVTLESLASIGLGVLDLADTSSELLGLGLGAGTLLIVYGLGQLFAAWRVGQGARWARAPLVVTQLIQLLLSRDVRSDDLPWLTPALAVSALVVLGCLLAPPVTRALSREQQM